MSDEWHSIGQHRARFEVRTDHSRFVVMGPVCSIELSRWRPQREPIARGVIDGNGYASGQGEPIVMLDARSDQLPSSVTAELLEQWKAMVDRVVALDRSAAGAGRG